MSGDGTAVISHASPLAGIFSLVISYVPIANLVLDIILTLMPNGVGTVTTIHCILDIHFTCYVVGIIHLNVELLLLMNFTSARRHDSKNFLYAIDNFGRNAFGILPKNVCLDSAHDNIPTYELIERWDINAFIDINGRTKSSKNYSDDIIFNKFGHPLCRAEYEMCP